MLNRRHLLAGTAAALALGGPRLARAAGAPIKLGAVVSASGPISFLGDPEMKTLKLYVDRINKSGGVQGRPIDLIAYDDASDTTQARSFALRLINQDQVAAIVGGTSTGTTMSIIPVVEDAELPFISLAGALTIVDPVKKWVFKTPATDRIAAQRSFQHMKAHEITKVGMLNGSDGYGQSGREQSRLVAKDYGIDLVADETYAPSDTDMTGQLARIRSAGAQAILNFGTGAGPSIIARNVKQLGMTIPLYLSPAIASNAFITTTGPASEGVLVPVAALLIADKLPDSDPQKKVCLDYTKLYTDALKEPPSYGGGTAYDGLFLMTGAMDRAIAAGKGTDPEAVRDQIERTKNFVGIDGIFNMSPKDHMGLGPDAFRIAVIKGGQWLPAD
jgi:branched-chain amino acid transport system substrate-binding protein